MSFPSRGSESGETSETANAEREATGPEAPWKATPRQGPDRWGRSGPQEPTRPLLSRVRLRADADPPVGVS